MFHKHELKVAQGTPFHMDNSHCYLILREQDMLT